MKIRDLLEAKDFNPGNMPDGSGIMGALPDAHAWPELDNSSGYLAYRFGVALAGLPDYKMDVAGPTGLKMVTIGYTEAERAILDAAQGLTGTPKVRLSPGGSTENKDVSTTSPVNNWNAKKTTKRTKKD
jgi:hypothetical protein